MQRYSGRVERAASTDERLDDLARRMDSGFERVDAGIRELRGDVGALRTEVHGESGARNASSRFAKNFMRTTIPSRRVHSWA